ncbi:MAG: DUF4336 domain-containing protein [Rhizobiaceae bacterium]
MQHMGTSATYEPVNTLKPVAEDIWIVDGPVIRFGMPWPKMPFPTRMTIIRLKNGDLLLHSPTTADEGLIREVKALGAPRHLIAPNRIHYWWIPDWHATFPDAEVWLAPRVRQQAGGRISFETSELAGRGNYPWEGEVDTLTVEGGYMTEIVFFHRASRTLVLTDMIENFEPRKVGPLMRVVAWLGGVLAPDGQMPRDMRLTYRSNRAGMKEAVERMIGWDPEHVIIAHGKWFRQNGAAELRRAFRWLL